MKDTCIICGKPLEIVTYPELPDDVCIGEGPPVYVENPDGSYTKGYSCKECFDECIERDIDEYMERVMSKDD